MRAELKALFPAEVAGAELTDARLVQPLFPDETAAIVRAVDKRRNEFAMGRTCARTALAALGFAPIALPVNQDRSVRWPDSVVGSITHTDGWCIAIVGRRAEFDGVGVDAELRGRVTRKMWSYVATEREIAWLKESPVAEQTEFRSTLIFSAKEAFYKAQFCRSRAWLGFHDAEIIVPQPGVFELSLLKPVGDIFTEGQRFQGRYAAIGQYVVTGLVIGAKS